MSRFLRKLDEALHFPDRLLFGIHSSVTHRSTSPDLQKDGGSGREELKLPPSPRTVIYTGATSFTRPPCLGAPISPSEYSRMDRASEEQKQDREGGSAGQSSQPQAQSSYGQRDDNTYYEPIEQAGGGSVGGGGGIRPERMKHSEEMNQGSQGMRMDIVPMHLSELISLHPYHKSQDKEVCINDIPV